MCRLGWTGASWGGWGRSRWSRTGWARWWTWCQTSPLNQSLSVDKRHFSLIRNFQLLYIHKMPWNALLFPIVHACQFFVKWHTMAIFENLVMQNVQSSNWYYRQSRALINMKPTPGTAPWTHISGEVISYIFISPSVGPPTLTNWRVSYSCKFDNLDNYFKGKSNLKEGKC